MGNREINAEEDMRAVFLPRNLPFVQLFADFKTMHTYANSLYGDKDEDERERLIEEVDRLYDKWCDYMYKQAAREVMAELNEKDNE